MISLGDHQSQTLMKQLVIALTLLACSASTIHAQSAPIAEYVSIYNAGLGKWGDTTQTFSITYDAAGQPSIRTFGNYQTTYSDFAPATGQYATRFYWRPGYQPRRTQVDSMTTEGQAVPLRLDVSTQPTELQRLFERSFWTDGKWVPTLKVVSEYDTLGILRSQKSYTDPMKTGVLTLSDSFYTQVTQNMKGSVLAVDQYYWSATSGVLEKMMSQKYVLNASGGVGEVEFTQYDNGVEMKSHRLRDIEWHTPNRSIPYVQREQQLYMAHGGDAYKFVTIDAWEDGQWTPTGYVWQEFDAEGRVISYRYNEQRKDTFSFHPDGTLAWTQRSDGFGGEWYVAAGAKNIRTYNGDKLATVTLQNFDGVQYANDRVYIYSYSAATVAQAIQASVNISPNPFTSNILVTADSEIRNIRLLSVDGREILRQDGEAANTVNAVDLPDGVYFLQVELPHTIETRKVVKQ